MPIGRQIGSHLNPLDSQSATLPDVRSASMLIQSMHLSGVAGMWPVAGCGQMHTRLTQHGILRQCSIARMWTTPARCLCQSQATNSCGNGDGEAPGASLQQSGGIPINELGGRFGMALSALRGEFDPDANVENTEKSQNLILGALVQFPAQHTFNVVVKPPVVAGAGPIAQDAILGEVQGAIARVYRTELSSNDCKVTERLRGKFLSIKLQLQVSSAEQVADIYTALGEHPWVIMNF